MFKISFHVLGLKLSLKRKRKGKGGREEWRKGGRKENASMPALPLGQFCTYIIVNIEHTFKCISVNDCIMKPVKLKKL